MFFRLKDFNPYNTNYFVNNKTGKLQKVILYTSEIHSIVNELFERISYSTFISNNISQSSIRILQSPLTLYNTNNFIDITKTIYTLMNDKYVNSEISIVFPKKTVKTMENIYDTYSTFSHTIDTI